MNQSIKQKLYCYVDETGQDTKKRGSFAEASSCGTDVPRSPDTRNIMLTQPIKNVKLNMAESGGHDPQPVRLVNSCIKRSPTLWDSLSNHKFIIAFHHKKTTVTFRSEGGTTYREETSYAYRFLEAAQKG